MDSKLQLEILEEKYSSCERCGLCKTRLNVVWGDGNPLTAKVLILGEAPGKDEDEQSVPFIGRSGSLLRQYLNKAGFEKEEYFITNSVLCRPPENRVPTQEEIVACSDRLKLLIDCMDNLKVIMAVGQTSINNIHGTKNCSWKTGKSSKMYIKCGNIKVVIWGIVHPSYLLRRGKPEQMMLDWLKELENVRCTIREGS